jgi:hypothetical protein
MTTTLLTTTLRDRAPSARCYQCGSLTIKAVCHECGRTMCGKHVHTRTDGSNRPVSKEFVLTLGPESKAPVHCADHDHVVKGRLTATVWLGGITAVIGGVLAGLGGGLAVAVPIGIGLLAAGLVGGGLGAWFDRRRRAAMLAARPALPLVPSVDAIRIDERVAGRLTLADDGSYHTSVDLITGELDIDVALGRNDRERLANYRTGYQLDRADDVEFSAGFAVLEGTMGLDFAGEQGDQPVVALSGKVSEIPFLDGIGGRPAGQWRIRRPYELKPVSRIDTLPIWLTPSIEAASDRRNLELLLQWVDFLPDERAGLEVESVPEIEIRMPTSWGHIESVHPRADGKVGEAGGYLKLVRPTVGDGRLQVSVQFENQICMSDTISGRLRIVFRNTLSGVRGVRIHHPLGHRRDVDKQKIESRITLTVEFELSLAGIRYQDYRVVPDSKLDKDSDKPESQTFPGVIPDYETVVALTNAMSDQGYYVKGVIDNPPRTSAKAGVLNRTWDISGRRYDGVYPVDFHIVLTGDEVHRGDIRAHTGTTTVRMTVQGTYANDELEQNYANGEMEQLIEQAWEGLHELLTGTLETKQRVDSVDAAQPYFPDQDDRPARHAADETERARRRRRDEATDALLAGRISEQTFREILRRIDGDEG